MAHSLDVWYLLPQGAMVHIRQIDAPAVPAASPVPDPRGTSEQIGGRTWTRVALAGLPGAAEFSTRFDDGVRLSIDFTTGEVDAGPVLASLHSGQP